METYDKKAAYRAVMDRVRAKAPGVSPQTWLAEQLGLSRQIIHLWGGRSGIPETYAETIAELLDMDPVQVCPTLFNIYIPEPVFNAVVAVSTTKKPFHIKVVDLIKLGLKRDVPSAEPFHVAPKSAPLTKSTTKTLPAPPMKPVGGFIPISADELRTQREEAVKAGADLSIKGRAK